MPAVADCSTPASSASMRDERIPQRKLIQLVRPPVNLAEGPFNQDMATRAMIANLKRGIRQGPTEEQLHRLMSDLAQDIDLNEPAQIDVQADEPDISEATAS